MGQAPHVGVSEGLGKLPVHLAGDLRPQLLLAGQEVMPRNGVDDRRDLLRPALDHDAEVLDGLVVSHGKAPWFQTRPKRRAASAIDPTMLTMTNVPRPV